VRLGGDDRNWRFSSTGFDEALAYVIVVGSMLGATTDTDLALDPLLPPAPSMQIPMPILQRAELTWSEWWEASVSEYRRASRDEEMHRNMATCEALAGSNLSLMLNRVRRPLIPWLLELDPSEVQQHSVRELVADSESAHGRRARDFRIRFDLLPVAGPIVLVVSEDPAEAKSRLLISSALLRTPGQLDRILGDALDRVAF